MGGCDGRHVTGPSLWDLRLLPGEAGKPADAGAAREAGQPHVEAAVDLVDVEQVAAETLVEVRVDPAGVGEEVTEGALEGEARKVVDGRAHHLDRGLVVERR